MGCGMCGLWEMGWDSEEIGWGVGTGRDEKGLGVCMGWEGM